MARKKRTPDSRLGVRYIDNKILLSATHAWTYVRLPLIPYEFLSYTSREGMCDQITLALASLVTSNQEAVDVHLRITHRPFDTGSWAKTLDDRVKTWSPTPGWPNYLTSMGMHVHDSGFDQKEVYLGVCLGERRTAKHGPKGSGPMAEVTSALRGITSVFENAGGFEDLVVSESELDLWHSKAKDVHRTLANSQLKGIPATSKEVAWLIAKPLWPGMQQPSPTSSEASSWGPGEVRALGEGVVTNNRRWVEVEQMGPTGMPQTGYAVTLAVSRFPDVMMFPDNEPWMHYAAAFPFVTEFSTRMSIVPAAKVKKDVGRKLADAKDQAQHIAEAGTSIPLQVREQLEVATVLEYQIDKDRMPWAYARHRLTVTGSTPEEVSGNAKTLIESYRDLSIDLAWPTGDQFDLLCESMPGDKVRTSSYMQRQELAAVAGGMPTASAECGDRRIDGRGWFGPYLGYTTSRVVTPVFLSPHVAMARNYPPGVSIVGSPGGGKALAVDTPIPTPDGWKQMGDLRQGDLVFAADGTPTYVVDTSPVFTDHNCYRIEFDDGSFIVADEGHRWAVDECAQYSLYNSNTANNYNAGTKTALATETTENTQATRVLTTGELFGAFLNKKENISYTIPAAGALTLPGKDSLQDPYMLGIGLGTEGSRIPSEYLRASQQQRRRLLAGLLDSPIAGQLPKENFFLTEPGLADDIYELLMTLGFIATRATVGSLCTVTFSKEENTTRDVSGYQRMVISVSKVPTVETKCITVADSSHLFLAGTQFVPTHNSFSAFTLAYQMAMQGVWTIYIDPKADAKPMAQLGGLGNPRIFDLRDGNDGMLDPFSLGENRSESTLLALETLRLLLGGNVSEEREEALLNAVEQISQTPSPSLSGVVDILLANEESAGARNLGAVLRTIRELPFARLCFAPTGGNRFRPEDGLTVVTLLGLDLPSASTRSDDYSYENRLAVSVMYLLTRYARGLMLSLDKSHPKAICIDEAWAITSTPQGAKLIPEIARMGRSHNTALVLVSQNARDLMAESVTNSISTKLAFRSTIPAEIDDVLTLFGLDLDQGYQGAVRDLRNGECLMQDVDGRVSRVRIDDWNQELFDAFNTNPETRGKGSAQPGQGGGG